MFPPPDPISNLPPSTSSSFQCSLSVSALHGSVVFSSPICLCQVTQTETETLSHFLPPPPPTPHVDALWRKLIFKTQIDPIRWIRVWLSHSVVCTVERLERRCLSLSHEGLIFNHKWLIKSIFKKRKMGSWKICLVVMEMVRPLCVKM